MNEGEPRQAFQNLRWTETAGDPVCPRCGCLGVYRYQTRALFKCKGCEHQFSVTSGTIFASHKLPVQTILLAIAIFVNGAKGHSALQLSRDLDVQYKTAFVLSHKIREALASEQKDMKVGGTVEVDGAYFGGHIRPSNWAENRVDRRLAINQTGKRRVVVIMRERAGRTLPFVFKTEAESIPTIEARVDANATIHADEATHWDNLETFYLTKRINHQDAYSDGEACTQSGRKFILTSAPRRNRDAPPYRRSLSWRVFV